MTGRIDLAAMREQCEAHRWLSDTPDIATVLAWVSDACEVLEAVHDLSDRPVLKDEVRDLLDRIKR